MQVVKAVAFIDWNSQRKKFLRNTRYNDDFAKDTDNHNVLIATANHVSRLLRQQFPDLRFSITLRLYGGWHDGHRPTQWRIELGQLNDVDVADLSSSSRVMFRKLEFGDLSLSALDRRLSPKFPCHYPFTLQRLTDCRCGNMRRGQHGRCNMRVSKQNEKMVDTALVSDLVYCASRTYDDSWLFVVGEDVDLVPGLFTAESFLEGSDRQMLFFKSEDHWSVHCSDLVIR